MRRAAAFTIACMLGAAAMARAQSAQVSIPAWVEAEGDAAAAPAFEAMLNGEPAAIESQLGPSSDQVILVVMDVTDDPSLVDAARQALAAEVAKLPGNAWVGVLRAQDGLHVIADPGPDRRAAAEAIEGVPNSGNPGLLETVQPALSLADGLMRKAAVRVSVLYVTDGNISNYREDFTNPVINQSDPHDLSRRFPEALVEEKISKLVDATAALEAPLFVVHLHDRSDRLNRAYESGLETLADATGGRAEFCRSVAEIPEAIASAFGRISSCWRLTLAVPPGVRGLAQVRLSARQGEEEARLSWRGHVAVSPGAGKGRRGSVKAAGR